MNALPAHTQVLVVGAGPAGSRAAWHLARAGLEVVLIDRRTTVGVPVQCAEFLPRPMAGLAYQLNALVQPLQGMHSHTGQVSEYQSFPGVMIDRACFDQGLARRAQAAGARLFLQCRLQDVRPAKRIASVCQRGEFKNIQFDYLIAADGPRSRVAQCCGLPPLELVHAWQMTVPLSEACKQTRVWLGEHYPGGYAWFFPKAERALIGFGIHAQAGRCRIGAARAALLDLWREQQRLGRVAGQVSARTAGVIPVSGLRRELFAGPVLFAGDAAGCSHPITGAGIAAAVQSGELAALAVAQASRGDAGAVTSYAREMQFLFGQTLTQAVQQRRQWLSTPVRQRYHWSVLQRVWPGFHTGAQRTGT